MWSANCGRWPGGRPPFPSVRSTWCARSPRSPGATRRPASLWARRHLTCRRARCVPAPSGGRSPQASGMSCGVAGAAHAAEHTAIGLLPLFASCDRMDIGGVSADLHPATGQLTVFVYDGNAGGAGFAERGFAVAQAWLRATAEAIMSCECQAGCPSCVQSPKCGTGNDPLAKDGAVLLLETLLAGAPAAVPAEATATSPEPAEAADPVPGVSAGP